MYTASELMHTSQAAQRAVAARFRDHSSTIIGVPFESPHSLRSLLGEGKEAVVVPEDMSGRLFKIRAADSHGHRSSASILINKMYATRGYTSTGLPLQSAPDRITLTACENETTVGTITVGFDSPQGLYVDDLFRFEVDGLRRRRRGVCEFTKLAVDTAVRSKRVLASLFHVAYIYAHRVMRVQDLLIEVNPRHVRYYERMLGFVVKGPERLNQRVNAPAVLLGLDFEHAQEQIGKFGGRPKLADKERSLYPYFFSVAEEAGIVGRLSHRMMQTTACQ